MTGLGSEGGRIELTVTILLKSDLNEFGAVPKANSHASGRVACTGGPLWAGPGVPGGPGGAGG